MPSYLTRAHACACVCVCVVGYASVHIVPLYISEPEYSIGKFNATTIFKQGNTVDEDMNKQKSFYPSCTFRDLLTLSS